MKAMIELYLAPKDIQGATDAVAAVLANKESKGGVASLCGAICAELGKYYNGEELLSAFFAVRVRKDELIGKLVAFAREMVARGVVCDRPANYNDLDDDLWVQVQDMSETTELPFIEEFDDPKERKPNGRRDYTFFFTRYTIYHESHGHCFIFFLKENTYTDEAGNRCVFSTELHFRRVDDVDNEFKKTAPEALWSKYVRYGDGRDPGFTFSGNYQEKRTEAEADLWAHNMWSEVSHFEAIKNDPELL